MTNRFYPFLALLAGVALALPVLTFASVRVESQTLIRYFERDTLSSSNALVLPIYEYLELDANKTGGAGVSFHGYGWGRADAGDNEFFEDRTDGELLYGYFKYVTPDSAVDAKLGRFQHFGGVTSDLIDGAALTLRPLGGLSFSAYGGLPAAYAEMTGGTSGDLIAGGRLGFGWGALYDFGVSYKYLQDNDDVVTSDIALDFALTMPLPVSLRGFSTYDTKTDEWGEHYYIASAWLGAWLLEPFYQSLNYQGFFNTGENPGSPFRLLNDTEELLTVYGATLSWAAEESLGLNVNVRQYNHKQSEEDATYASLTVDATVASTMLGAEGGWMDGDSEMNNYQLGRIYFHTDMGRWFISGDAMYVRYQEKILDEKDSTFISLGGGIGPLKGLTLKLSGDYSIDPYFEKDVRGLMSVIYIFDYASGGPQ